MIKKYTGRSLWLAGLMLTTLLTGCGGGGGSGSNTLSSTSTNDNAASWLVVETAPIDNAKAVALNSKVVVTFSEAMVAASFTDASFTVIGKNETALVGTVSYNVDSKTASFKPNRDFTASTLYTATLTTTVKSVAGQTEASNYIWSFTTGATTDTTAPTVISTDPGTDATDVIPNRSVTARFSEAIDPDTVNTTNFTLSVGAVAGGTPVPGVVSYNNKVATFNPDVSLNTTTDYTVTLTTGITDIAKSANALLTDKVWTFKTGSTVAAGPAPVNLSTAGDFVILTKTGITNVPTSAITGNIGASPITAAAMDTVSCTEMTGIIYGADAAYPGQSYCFKGTAPDNTLVANAVLDMGIAYTDAAGRTEAPITELYAGDISGQILDPGLYKWGTNVWINTGGVTLNGGPNDVWIFQISGDLLQASNTQVHLTGGALAKNVFWQVGGGAGVDIGTGATFEGVVLAAKAVAIKTGATVNGRLLSQTAVTLQKNTVKEPVL